MAATKVMPCTCKNDYQDKRYGKDQRLHNEYLKPSPGGWRCSVCDRNK